MTKEETILLAGFGGQGILFTGKVIAYAGLTAGHEVSWLPSYGPEMRGGTANCSVTVSDEPIGSPLIINPSVLVAMNTPSLDKFVDNVVPGGIIIIDSTLISEKVERTDITTFYVPSTGLADEKGLKGLANMIILGKLLKETKLFTDDEVLAGLKKTIPARKAALLDKNIEAIKLGMTL